MKIIIVGAGISGIIAAKYFSSYAPEIYEASPSQAGVDGHNAVLRIKDPKVGIILGCQLQKIKISKEIYFKGSLTKESNISINNLYSLKTTGGIYDRSISGVNAADKERYIFDYGIHNSFGVHIKYGHRLISIDEKNKICTFVNPEGKQVKVEFDICISTVAMPIMMKILKMESDLAFESLSITVASASVTIPSEVHQTIYIPEIKFSTYRATLTGQTLIVELMGDHTHFNDLLTDEIKSVIKLFGLCEHHTGQWELKKNKNNKIMSIDDDTRKSIILEMTKRFSIYQLGRFAIWKPALKIDELIGDLDKINHMIKISGIRREYESHTY